MFFLILVTLCRESTRCRVNIRDGHQRQAPGTTWSATWAWPNTRNCLKANSNSRDSFVRRKLRKQFCDRSPLPRQNQFRRKLAQRLKNKSALMCARMRQSQFRRMADFVAKRDQIQIQRTRLVGNFLGLAAEFFFQFAQFFKQRFRRFTFSRNETDDGVHKLRRSRRTIHRRRQPKGSFEDWRVRKILQPRHRFQNYFP